jgi:hypothetical protein
MSINNITTSPIHDIENQYRMSPYRELEIYSSPVTDVENQLPTKIPIIRPKAQKPKTQKKGVTIQELYNKNHSFYKHVPPAELLTRPKKPLTWIDYKKTHMSPVGWKEDDPIEWKEGDVYLPGGSTRKKKRNTKRKKSKRKTNKKLKRNPCRKSCKKSCKK